jgi:uncharacterized protein
MLLPCLSQSLANHRLTNQIVNARLTSTIVNHEKNMQLFEIVEYWSYWNKPLPKSVLRNVDLPASLNPKFALVIQGVRRCGKSTFLSQLISRYSLDPKDCLFINFEDPRLFADLNTTTLDELVSFFRTQRGRERALYYFFDEIQNIPNWQKWLHTIIERSSLDHFIVTGSNAKLLSRELGATLTGRHRLVTLFPFSFEEAVLLKKGIRLEEYLVTGGFPSAIGASDSEDILRQFFTDIVERDVITRLGISQPRVVKQILSLIFQTAGSECSFRKIAGNVGISPDTVASYVSACEDAYLIFSCPYFSYSEKQRIRRNNKFYPVDSAFRRSVITQGGKDREKDFEITVYLALRRLGYEVSYWKGKNEVDFVVTTVDGVRPVQVSLNEPKERHEAALIEFHKVFPSSLPEVYINLDNFLNIASLL